MRLAALSLVLLAGLACQDASSPVDPVWGKQACASCSMLVSDRRFAAELVAGDGTRVFFDDPGCMATWLSEGHGPPRHAWVHSAADTWIDARTARYARRQSSPMGFDFAPSESGDAEWADVEASARARASKGVE
jgi:hypothetical protein